MYVTMGKMTQKVQLQKRREENHFEVLLEMCHQFYDMNEICGRHGSIHLTHQIYPVYNRGHLD
jgi:hypothetical protein